MMFHVVLFLSGCLFLTGITHWSSRSGQTPLVLCLVLQSLLANLLVQKQVLLLGWHATPSDALAVGALYGLNVLQRQWGRQAARQAIALTFLSFMIVNLVFQWQLMWQPAPEDTMHVHYQAILGGIPRLLVASCLAYWAAQWTDLCVYSALLRLKCANLWAVLGSLTVSEAVDTAAFTFLGLWGTMGHLSEVLVVSYTIKMSAVVVMVFFGTGLLPHLTSASSTPLSSPHATS